MPIYGEDSDTFRVFPFHISQHGKSHDDRQACEADNDVERVQANQRVVRGSEEVGTDRQAFVIDESILFPRGSHDENQAQRDRAEPKDPEPSEIAPRDRAFRHGYREAA